MVTHCSALGRWWVVGSAWTGRDTNATVPVGLGSESWVAELARKQRMNTDIRKTVFSVIMTSEVCELCHELCVVRCVSFVILGFVSYVMSFVSYVMSFVSS